MTYDAGIVATPCADQRTRTTAFMKWVSAYSSRVTRFKVFAHTSIIFLPVGIEPVKEIFCVSGWLTIQGPSFSSPPRTCSMPGGKIAWPTSTALRVVYGVYGLNHWVNLPEENGQRAKVRTMVSVLCSFQQLMLRRSS